MFIEYKLLPFCLLVVINVGSVSVDVLVVYDSYGVLIFHSGDGSAFHEGSWGPSGGFQNMCVGFPICVGMVVGQLVWHGVDGGKGGGGVPGLVAVKLRCVKFPL